MFSVFRCRYTIFGKVGDWILMNDLLKVRRSNMPTTFAMAVSLWQAADVLLCICVLLSIILVCGMMNCDLWRWTACV